MKILLQSIAFVSIFLILYSYIFYPMLLSIFIRLRKNRTAVSHDTKILPHVTIVIAAHNEDKVIERKINNTLELDYPKDKIEIIIGSDGSDDRTDEICKQYSHVIKFKRIEPRQGKANVLNILVPLAKGDILLFTDANTILEKGSLRTMAVHFSDQSIGGVCGMLLFKSKEQGLESYESIYWSYESKIKTMESQVYSTLASNGGIYVVRRELFTEIPKNTIIDDFWVSLNILNHGRRIIFEEDARAYENVSDTIVDEFWRKVRIGSGDLQTFLLRPFISGHNRLFIHIAYYSHKVIRWMIPLLLVFLYFSVLGLSTVPGFLMTFQLFNFLLLIAATGILLEVRIKIIAYISYFALLNFALFYGYFRYIMGRESVIWRRVERQ